MCMCILRQHAYAGTPIFRIILHWNQVLFQDHLVLDNSPVLGPCVLSYNLSPTTSRTSATFNESEVLRTGFLDVASNNVVALYSDEHALTLGVKTLNGATATFSDFTPISSTKPYNSATPVSFGFT